MADAIMADAIMAAGMLPTREIIAAVAAKLAQHKVGLVVVDPVWNHLLALEQPTRRDTQQGETQPVVVA